MCSSVVNLVGGRGGITILVNKFRSFFWGVDTAIKWPTWPFKQLHPRSFCICCIMTSRYLDNSVPGHFGTDLDISVLTWTSRYSVLDSSGLGWDNCLVLINCQYFCTSSSLIYDPKVNRCVFDNSSVDRSRRSLFLYIDFYLYVYSIYYLEK